MRETIYDVQMLWDEFRSIKQFQSLTKYCSLDSSFEIDGNYVLTNYELGKTQGAWELFLIVKGYNLRG